MAKQKQVVVFSPHMDDAVLDCCDHILEWRKNSIQVRVLTAFTQYSGNALSAWARSCLAASRCQSQGELEHRRASEDMKAMDVLNVSWNHLCLTDAAFRCAGGKPIYPNSRAMFSGAVSPSDVAVKDELRQAIIPFVNHNVFVVPVGVGNHIDHILVRQAVEELVPATDICYFLDYPYSLSSRNWTWGQAVEVATAKKSVKWMSTAKRRILACYSEIPQIFSGSVLFWVSWGLVRTYPEILLCP
jgi:LmbE family N-acetylglucosaminyl deacetylase